MDKLLITAALVGVCCLLLHMEKLMPRSGGGRVGVLLLLLAAMGLRYWLLDRIPSPWEDGVREALAYYRGAGGFWGLRSGTEPFSLPIQLLMALVSLVPRGSIYYFKFIGFLSDIACAWACQRCMGAVVTKPRPRLGVFLLALLLPGQLLCSCSGMAPGLRWVFVIAAASASLRGSFRLGGAMLGLAAAFHPGNLWLIPVFWVFPSVREHTFRTILWTAGVYLFSLLPFFFLGRVASLTLPFWPRSLSALSALRSGAAAGVYAPPLSLSSAAAGIAAYAVPAALAVYRLSGRDALRDRRRQLAGLCMAALAAALLLPGAEPDTICGAALLSVTLSALDPGAIPAAVCAAAASALSAGHTLLPSLVPFGLLWATIPALVGLLLLLGSVLFRRS